MTNLQDVPDALGTMLDCTALGEELLALSSDQEQPLPECGPTCLGQLCDEGLTWMWVQAEQAALSEKPLTVNASGDAEIDSEARPLRIGGTWAGVSNLIADTEVHVEGVFVATPDE